MFWIGSFICVFLVFVTATSYLAEYRGCSQFEAAGSIFKGIFLLTLWLIVLGVMLFYLFTLPKANTSESASAETTKQIIQSPAPTEELSEADKENIKKQIRTWSNTPSPNNPKISVMDQALADLGDKHKQ